jgi:hypothetical protein
MQYKLLRNSTDEDGEQTEVELLIEVDFLYRKGCKGYRNSLGVPEEPDEDPFVEVIEVKNLSGKDIELSPQELLEVEEACLESMQD